MFYFQPRPVYCPAPRSPEYRLFLRRNQEDGNSQGLDEGLDEGLDAVLDSPGQEDLELDLLIST